MIEINGAILTVFRIPVKNISGPYLYKQLESPQISYVSIILAVPRHQTLKKKFCSGQCKGSICQASLLNPA